MTIGLVLNVKEKLENFLSLFVRTFHDAIVLN